MCDERLYSPATHSPVAQSPDLVWGTTAGLRELRGGWLAAVPARHGLDATAWGRQRAVPGCVRLSHSETR